MNVLVAYGSKRQGTAGIADVLAAELRRRGLDVELAGANDVESLEAYDAVVVGGALYAGRWHRDARRFVKHFTKQLRGRPVFFFSSGPLDDSATEGEIPPTRQVRRLMERVGAREHNTFGGRLAPNAEGFAAAAMAKEHAGDWRDEDDERRWADRVAEALAKLPAQS
jgi:menaquinone-dependent protoporphyrinogen oxidase